MRYILGVIGVVFVAILAIFLVTRDRSPEQPEGQKRVVLSQEAKPGTSAALVIQGKLVGQSDRRAIRIKITQEERRVEVLTGYEEAVDRSHTFPNTPAAYETFLVALERLGFSRKREAAVRDDERGVCPTGKTYIYEFKEYSQQLIRLWNTSCGSESGTAGGQGSTIQKLFKAQIPEYRKLVKDVDL